MNFTILTGILFGMLILYSTPVFATEISESLASLYSDDTKNEEVDMMWLGYHKKSSLEGYASAGFIVKTANSIVLIDPSSLLSEDIDALERIDVIFITHDHGDHFSADSTIQIQKKTGASVVANPAAFSALSSQIPADKLIEILPDDEVVLSDITVTAFLAGHPVETPLLYVIELDGFRIFHGSDSAFVEDLKKIESPVHIALVPAGDPSPTASPTDALEMTKATQTSVVIPMHGDTEQMKLFAKMVGEGDIQTKVVIPNPLEIISLDMTAFTEESLIPEWAKNIFVWYGQGQINEGEVLNAITFLVENKIIQIDTTGQSMSMMNQKMMMQNMPFNVDAPIIMPMIDGYYQGNKVYFVHTEVSDSKMADMMSKMINFPTLYVPELKNIPEDKMARVYVFTNGVPGSEPYGGGPFMFQTDVFDSIPGQAEYSQFRMPHLITWNDDAEPKILTSESAILKAESEGDLTIEKSTIVVNAPMITWEMQGNYGKTMGKTSDIPRMFESMSGVEGELSFVDENNYIAIFKLYSEKGMDVTGMMTNPQK